jgi:hypothetical protein
MDKGLYAAPLGIEEDMGMAQLEIEIEDPEGVSISMGDIEIELEPGKENTDEDFDANLADYIDDSALGSLGKELIDDFDKDIGDRRKALGGARHRAGLDAHGRQIRQARRIL